MGRSQLTIILLAALCVVGLYFDFFYQSASDDTSSLSLRFSWIGIPACASTSPPFQLGGVPTGTKYLSFTMTDLNAPSFHHGGSTVRTPEIMYVRAQFHTLARVHLTANATTIAGQCRLSTQAERFSPKQARRLRFRPD
jgi:hypothetical protein